MPAWWRGVQLPSKHPRRSTYPTARREACNRRRLKARFSAGIAFAMQNPRSDARAAKIFDPAGARERVHAHAATPKRSTVPAEFRAARQLCGLTLSELAFRATVSISQLSEFENGLAPLTRERLAAVSRALRAAIHAKQVAEAVQQKRPRATQNTAIRAQNSRHDQNCEASPHAGGTVIPLEVTKRGR